jgi:hypothetical protein
MTWKLISSAAALTFVGTLAAIGCSSPSTSNPDNPDSGPSVPDASKKDAVGPDLPDSSQVETGPTPEAGPQCVPADETGFTSTWHKPKQAAACTPAQITAYHTCLTDLSKSNNPTSCQAFTGAGASAANKACAACIETPDNAAEYGPVILHNGLIEPNLPGCVAIKSNDLNGTGCAAKFQAATQCRSAACATNCPVKDQASLDALSACETAAGSGTCKDEETAASCIDALADAGTVSDCFVGTDFDTSYDAVVPIFCGGATADAGTD